MNRSGKNIKCCNSNCNNEVYLWSKELKKYNNGKRKFCSKSCSNKTTSNGSNRKTGIDKVCPECNVKFYVSNWEIDKKCCSHKCASKHKTGISLGKDEYEIECGYCNNVFYVEKHRSNSAKYCSTKCSLIGSGMTWQRTSYNPSSIPIIEQYGKQNGYNFQHAENGGEYKIPYTMYSVDGYDEEKNVVIEYDEKHHFNLEGILKEKDIKRQKEIIDILGCKFVRINYKKEVIVYE